MRDSKSKAGRIRWAVVRSLTRHWLIAYLTGRLGLRTMYRPSSPLNSRQNRMRRRLYAFGHVVLAAWALVLVGGSGLAFFVYTSAMSDALGVMPDALGVLPVFPEKTETARLSVTYGIPVFVLNSSFMLLPWAVWNYVLLFIANPSRLLQYAVYPVSAEEFGMARLVFAFLWWGWLAVGYFVPPLVYDWMFGTQLSAFVVAWVGLSLLFGSYVIVYDLTAMKKHYYWHAYIAFALFIAIVALLDWILNVSINERLLPLSWNVLYGSGHPWLIALTLFMLGVLAQSLMAWRAGHRLVRVDFL
ncbi:MAG: hypothetical protein BSOLF_0562 [Candidatus Carbobacillus altaicus]|uniref:Uncharacterized protein n=1 Tax=Candidatus Carbonibacillus altaicus TaxID=2163959 RepID=A0A2R6Y0R3_9BACL|nr:MAG: hypothetical protein BSOLF_0562 [Candidatus Carbobacillus altaicus]